MTRLDNDPDRRDMKGKGTVGQLMPNRSLYDHADATLDEAQQLVKVHAGESKNTW